MKIIALALIACLTAGAQTAAPAFEVASVHLTEPGQNSSTIQTKPGSLTLRNLTLRSCLEWAYGLRPLQISGPVWMDDVRVDILGQTDDRTAEDDKLKLMLQTLLTSRFGMKAHLEKKEQSVYLLTVGKDGPKYHAKSTKDESTFAESTTSGSTEFSEDKTGATAHRVTMWEVANKLSNLLHRIIIDKTGLTGRYDFRIDIRPFLPLEPGGKPDIMSILFAGFNEQLGLRLEAGKEVVDLLVIDSVSRTPTAN